MKKNKSRRWIEIFERINEFMENNLEKWNSIEEIRRTYDDFINHLKKIREIQPELDQDLSALKKELAEKRDLLLQRLFPVGNVLEVYAEDHRIGKKARSLVNGQQQLESFGNRGLLDHASRLHRIVDKYMHRGEQENGPALQISPGKDIKRYGLTQSMMDQLHSAIHQFQSALELRNDVNTYRKRMQKKSDALIRANRKLLKNRLNKLMTVFSGTHPSFYKDFCEAGNQK